MNLTKLFETQKVLDERIVKEKGLEGQDLLPEKILALQVELGELANEWRGFKFWSEDREPRTSYACELCNGAGGHYKSYKDALLERDKTTCVVCGGTGTRDTGNPLLEEYVDNLHFILSIGNDLGFNATKPYLITTTDPIELFRTISRNIVFFDMPGGREHKSNHYANLLSNFFALGKSLGFTWEQIEKSYFEKNQINHERQLSGY